MTIAEVIAPVPKNPSFEDIFSFWIETVASRRPWQF
jgi:hypothetical protein